MRIAAVSDLHIGTRDHTCGFRHAPASFLGFLDRLEETHDEIVLLGDIWQCDHQGRVGPASERRALDRARTRTAWLTERVADQGYTLVPGNHDAVTAEALALSPLLVRRHGGRVAVLTHGDAYDPVIGRAPGVSRAATWLSGRLRAAGLRPLAEPLEEQDVQVKGRRFAGTDGPYARGAAALAAEHDAQVVVFGHTHLPTLEALPGAVLANSGTCSRARFMGVSVDLAAGTVALLGPGARETRRAGLPG